ncbi:diacylglycerol kinase catalytic region [Deinococcus proteolyticus MRP]|uniref:Diacylglycerol kinase catalytic region n=1 Tax=Deinococcus proteolyticus (strain ATCC 35074 / DSM 20540 / JCM 6276 / NBRC 101906 / NCIMB 13154 / VKM Ac-1939 / CCM 2703 / MRP) TaxID=693977 RepID=F0RML2_DEIPM|nr:MULTISPECIES: diacylglycerol kinase family protein [Deinococcus]ADY26062.1 diacylglycerol kinase catalytic region [Deinococcus proteolyticus MRP]MCY1702183.1 diacylglycerol kinase family lipid kinase [Deinococcus sp. SL84]
MAPLINGRPLAVVLNRSAGNGRAAREWPRLRGELHAWGVQYRTIESGTPAEALAAVRALPPGWAVAAVGGDGTVASVLPAVIEQERPLLVLPFGTGNDFAGTLGLRAGQFREVLAGLENPPRRVDALRVRYGSGPGTEAYSLNGAGMGFDAQLTANLPLAPAWTQGAARYVWAALSTLRAMQPQPCRVLLDGAELYSGPAMLCSVMNARTLGGGFQFNPAADLADGRLNVVVAGDVRRRQVPPLIARVRVGRHLEHPAVRYAAGQVAELHWEQPVQLHVDGDLRGEHMWLRAEVLPGAVQLLNGASRSLQS